MESEFGKQWATGTGNQYRDSYIRSITESKFVICPHGWATSTYRMFEVMELGRVPIVLADQWVAPTGPDWERCIVRVAENDFESLPERLHTLESQWEEMAITARTTWQDRFHPNAHARRILDWVSELTHQVRPVELELRKNWRRQEVVARIMLTESKRIASS